MTNELPNAGYLDEPWQWDALVTLCRAAGGFGCDSEFDGLNVGKQSCVGRARVHVWSVAVRTDRLDPRGYHRCRGYVLPASSLDYTPLRALLEDESVRKDLHNQSVDDHAFHNHGIRLRGARNTLGLVRWYRPELVNEPGRFKLKSLMHSMLGRSPVCTFKELVSYERQVQVPKEKQVTRQECSCGVEGCRKRKGHEKREWLETVTVYREKTERGEYPLRDIVKGHERFPLLCEYAVEDAVAAEQLGELCDETDNPAPFPFAPHRPGFCQAVEDAIVEMERVGIPVDRAWARDKVVEAEAMEEKELVWLHKWFVANAPTEGPHRREGVDPIWSSPTQKVRLFDELGFPRSPVWAKGRVKGDDVKMDWRAMEWIAANHPPATKLLGRLLHLQRIRSGKKYLIKLRDSSGLINPICGPAGDDDDRAGAVTGRLGIKGELEAQQLPKEGVKDLFGVRRGLVANEVAYAR